MASRALLLLGVVSATAAGCGPPPAPDDLEALTHYLYASWNAADPQPMEDGIAKLEAQLASRDLTGSVGSRSFQLVAITAADLHDVAWPRDRDPASTIGSAVARESEWPVADHVRLQAEIDQLPWEPSATHYARTFVDPPDPACFVAQTCPVVLTDNDVTRENALLEVTMTLHKSFRWVKVDGGGPALIARSFNDRSWPGKSGGTAIHQSYAVDAWLPQASGKTIRYQALWQEAEVGIAVTDDLALAVITTSTDGAFRACDEQIGKKYHGL